jgi:predicted nucleic acid-binding protein
VIVIDASALAKFILREEGWERVYRILSTRVISVDHIVKEVTNTIWLESELKYPVYDELYITQAITHNVPLATSDKRQAEVAEKLKVQVIFIP